MKIISKFKWPHREVLKELSRRSWSIKLNWFYNEAEHVCKQIYMTCNNRRLELAAEVISSILQLSIESRLQFLNIKAFTSVSKGRRLCGSVLADGPLPVAQMCFPWFALCGWAGGLQFLVYEGIINLQHKATKTSAPKKLLPLKSNPVVLSFWKSLSWMLLGFLLWLQR